MRSLSTCGVHPDVEPEHRRRAHEAASGYRCDRANADVLFAVDIRPGEFAEPVPRGILALRRSAPRFDLLSEISFQRRGLFAEARFGLERRCAQHEPNLRKECLPKVGARST
jgi:hypothetical protein